MSTRTEFSDLTAVAGFESFMNKLDLLERSQAQTHTSISESHMSLFVANESDEIFVPPARRYVPSAGTIGEPKKNAEVAHTGTTRLLNILLHGSPTAPEEKYFSSTLVSPSHSACIPQGQWAPSLCPASEESEEDYFSSTMATPGDTAPCSPSEFAAVEAGSNRLLNILLYGTPTAPDADIDISSTVATPSHTGRIPSPDYSDSETTSSYFSTNLPTPADGPNEFMGFQITDKPGPLGFAIFSPIVETYI